jgi:hypothetical protein
MKTFLIIFSALLAVSLTTVDNNGTPKELNAESTDSAPLIDSPAFKPALVDYDAFEALVKEVKAHRQRRLVNLDQFVKMSKELDVIIIDTRSDEMYKARHIAGAVHLNFSDFTQDNLADVIPSPNYRVLIYCNNNIEKDEEFFPTKAVMPLKISSVSNVKPITLALNIPTYINLYGYGYRNVYELSELISIDDKRITFEGTAIEKP